MWQALPPAPAAAFDLGNVLADRIHLVDGGAAAQEQVGQLLEIVQRNLPCRQLHERRTPPEIKQKTRSIFACSRRQLQNALGAPQPF